MKFNIKNFSNSKLKDELKPDQDILSGISMLEAAMYKADIIDEAVETMTIASYHITYKKAGKDILMIRPSKSDWYVKLLGTSWDIEELSHLSVTFLFEINPTGWYLGEMSRERNDIIASYIVKAYQPNLLNEIIKYPLTVLFGYLIKNPQFFNNPDENTLNKVISLFWDGNFEAIQELYDSYFSMGYQENELPNFLEAWYKKINCISNLSHGKLSDHMVINDESFQTVLSVLDGHVNKSLDKFKQSLNSIWDNEDLIINKELFLKEIEKIRSEMVLTKEFINEFKSLKNTLGKQNNILKKEVVAIPEKQENIITDTTSENTSVGNTISDKLGSDDWFQYFIESKKKTMNPKEIPFQTKNQLLGDHAHVELQINEKRLRNLTERIAPEKRSIKEISILIKLLVENSNYEGFVTKEYLRDLFVKVYDNQQDLVNYSQRYGVKTIFAKSRLKNQFHTLIELLKKKGLLKETFRNTGVEIYWNHAIYVFQEY